MKGWLSLGVIGLWTMVTNASPFSAQDVEKQIPFWRVSIYEPSYLLATYTQSINRVVFQHTPCYADGLRGKEIKFQLSFFLPIWDGLMGSNSCLGFSYTQRSWWQAFNATISSPFRETNYEPQLFMTWVFDNCLFNWRLSRLECGLNHQSNGRSQLTSRSWNRLYARFVLQRGPWEIDWKPWYRFPERAETDDNPDINRYLGYYQLRLRYQFSNRSRLSLNYHYCYRTGYGGVELGCSYPLTSILQLYGQWFSGYGESLIDYNCRQSRFGVGLQVNG